MCACLLQHLKQKGNTHPIHVQITKHVNPREEAKEQATAAREAVIASAQEKRLKKNRAVKNQMVKLGLLEEPVPFLKRLAASRSAASKVSVSQATLIDDRAIPPCSGPSARSRPSMRVTAAGNEKRSIEDKSLRNNDNGNGEDREEIRPPAHVSTEGTQRQAVGDSTDGIYNGAGCDEETGNAGVDRPGSRSELDEVDQSLEIVKLDGSRLTADRRRVKTGTGANNANANRQEQQQLPPKQVAFKGAVKRVRAINMTRKMLGQNDDQLITIPAEPRPFIAAVVPIGVAVAVGLLGTMMIYGLAANLGPENTKVWLIAAATSFVTKMFIIQPLRVFAAAVLLKCADAFHSATLERLTRAIDVNGGV
jgi:hypothetical protein